MLSAVVQSAHADTVSTLEVHYIIPNGQGIKGVKTQGPNSDRYSDLVQMVLLVQPSVHTFSVSILGELLSPEPGGSLSSGTNFGESDVIMGLWLRESTR